MRASPPAFCTFSSCRRLRGVAWNPPEKKEIAPRRRVHKDCAEKKIHLLVSASTPGSLRPPRNSREAPPPVEMCEILPATPDWWTAATASPPPTIEVAPPLV